MQNLYKPYFLSAKFDYIIGNPPWFTYSSIKNEEYQNTLNELAEKYKIKPDKVANFPHLEIAAIFLAHCTNYFLNDNGKLAFVLPRSFFSADHHDNTRSGNAKGFKLTAAWDLKDVAPLFRIPSCVLFAEKKFSSRKISAEGLPGIAISASLPAQNSNLKTVESKLHEQPVTWFYVKQGKATALSKTNSKTSGKVNPYKKEFKQGATIVPRSFYFVELTQEVEDFEDRILHVKTDDAIKPDAKKPWDEIDLKGRIESRFLFRTALSKSILPFALYKPNLVVLPIIIETNNGIKKIVLQDAKELQRKGFLDEARWFANASNIWNIHRTEKSKRMTSNDRIDFQRGLSSQNLNAQYLVLYNTLGKDANATVIDRKNIDLEFFVDYKAYVFYANEINEAFYLTAILNSSIPNELIKDFQARGLFGARGVEKKILDVYFPKFNEKNNQHVQLAQVGEQAHAKAKAYLTANVPKQELSAIFLGRLRVEIKKHLKEEMGKIDELVKELIV